MTTHQSRFCFISQAVRLLAVVMALCWYQSVSAGLADSALADAGVAPCGVEIPADSLCARLHSFAQWLEGLGRTRAEIAEAVTARRATLQDKTVNQFNSLVLDSAGSGSVTICVFIQGNCGMCKRLTLEMYEQVTSGQLKGVARLEIRTFGVSQAEAALVAAARQGRFWPFLQQLGLVSIRLDERSVMGPARAAQLDTTFFLATIKSAQVRDSLQVWTQEAKQGGVSLTPTYYIDSVRYSSYKDAPWVVDAVLYRSANKAATEPRGTLRQP